MTNKDITLMAHLMRRGGFGAPYEELQRRVAKGYAATVEELLNPENQPEMATDMMERYFRPGGLPASQAFWTYRIIATKRPLEEKIALFWHGIFCTGYAKLMQTTNMLTQLDRFRSHGLGRFPDLLLQLATDPTMVYYLDNCMSHKDAINENWGRELLELFSMGVGMDGQPNYTEEDVKVAARAFTGWTVGNAIPRYPYNRHDALFCYNPDDHDDSMKTFLGETGKWNGGDIIDIICQQPATARFVARHLYNFFAADEPQVPAWQNTPPRDPAAIKLLEEEYFKSKYDIRSMLRVLFNSDFFKEARFAKVKSPTETVASILRLIGGFERPRPGLVSFSSEIRYMGQDLLNPPTVEGWHTGKEWIDSGTLLQRINFAAGHVGNLDHPGIRAIVNRFRSEGEIVLPERLVDACLEMVGGYELPEATYRYLLDKAQEGGVLHSDGERFAQRVGQVLQLIVSTQEYQFV